MFGSAQDFYYLVFGFFGSSGLVAGAAQLVHYFLTRKRERPEVDKIITEGARNAVEALQVALEQSRLEKADLQAEIVAVRKEMAALEAKHKAEIERMASRLDSAQRTIDAGQVQITQLSKDLHSLMEKVNSGGTPTP